jgi:hypothetical protein
MGMKPETFKLTLLAIELKTLALRVSRRIANDESAQTVRRQDVAILNGAAQVVDRLAARAELRP